MKISAYLKSNCRRSGYVRAILNKYNLYYEEYEMIEAPNPKTASIRVEIDGIVLFDVSGEAVENYLLEKGIIDRIDKNTEVASPVDEEKEAIRSKITRFF